MITAPPVVTAPPAPGRMGTPVPAPELQHYLEALGAWRDQRRRELDLLDEAALAASEPDAFTGDMQLAMALWKAVADRHDLLLATWDSGRAGVPERERMSTLIWGRLDPAPDPVRTGAAAGAPATSLAVSLPEACRLSDALASSLRTRLALGPSDDTTARLRQLRAQVERIRDLVDREPAGSDRERAGSRLSGLDRRVGDVSARLQRGADVGGLIGPLENDAALAERDLIVGSATRREDARDEARAHALRAELEARGAAVGDLADQCVARVWPAPRLAIPDVTALGPVPDTAAGVDAYLVRLDAVSRALTVAHGAYAAALDEREELRGRLEAYAAKAAAGIPPASPGAGAGGAADLAELARRAADVLTAEPADLPRARALVAAYQAYLTSWRPAPTAGRAP